MATTKTKKAPVKKTTVKKPTIAKQAVKKTVATKKTAPKKSVASKPVTRVTGARRGKLISGSEEYSQLTWVLICIWLVLIAIFLGTVVGKMG